MSVKAQLVPVMLAVGKFCQLVPPLVEICSVSKGCRGALSVPSSSRPVSATWVVKSLALTVVRAALGPSLPMLVSVAVVLTTVVSMVAV